MNSIRTKLGPKSLEPSAWDHCWLNGKHDLHDLSFPVQFSGAIRSLLRDGPLGALAAQLLRSDAADTTYQKLWSKGRFDGPHQDSYHVDSFNKKDTPDGMPSPVNMWVAITDAPHAIELWNGSHKLLQIARKDCNFYNAIGADEVGGKGGQCWDDHPARIEMVEKAPSSVFWTDIYAGDVLFFYQTTVHGGKGAPNGATRLAMAAGVIPNGNMQIHPRGINPWIDQPVPKNFPLHYSLWKFSQNLKLIGLGPLAKYSK